MSLLYQDSRTLTTEGGQPPHYITKKSEAQFICGGFCPRFTTNKICQHTVAASENCGKLSKFCTWWKTHCKGPDIDSLAVAGLPKRAGQKGGKPKRGHSRGKSKVCPSVTTDRVSNVTSYMGSSLPSSTTYMGFNFPEESDDNYAPSYNYHCDAPRYNYHAPNYIYESPSTGTNQSSSSNAHGSHVSISVASYSPAGTQPYFLKMLTKNIKVCAGCRLGYSNTLPPYDICIAHEETRQVPGKSFNAKTTMRIHSAYGLTFCLKI